MGLAFTYSAYNNHNNDNKKGCLQRAISSSVSLHHHSAILVCKQVFLIKTSPTPAACITVVKNVGYGHNDEEGA